MSCQVSIFIIAIVAACSGKGSTPTVDARTDGDRVDATIAFDATPPPTACTVEVVATSAECNEDCEVRLFLPSGGRFCTLTCADDHGCTPYDAQLTCAAEVGTCMPKCSTDHECQAQGLARCHPLGSFCDTLPPCQNNAQCTANGLRTCVMPGNYCQ